jgi:hypothetical protein
MSREDDLQWAAFDSNVSYFGRMCPGCDSRSLTAQYNLKQITVNSRRRLTELKYVAAPTFSKQSAHRCGSEVVNLTRRSPSPNNVTCNKSMVAIQF